MYYKDRFLYYSINIIVNMIFYTPICRTLYFVCIVWFSIIGNSPFIASDKCTQKFAHCIVLCSLHTSGLYNSALSVPSEGLLLN